MKTIHGILRSTVVLALAAILMTGNAFATSANSDLTDIWWNKNKNGTGYQFVNTGTFVFVTAFVYGVNREPFWISAQLNQAGTTYTGPLYVTSGPYYGGPYDSSTFTARQAGTMTFASTSLSTGQLSYTVDGVAVNEPLERQPLTLDFYGGLYKTYVTATQTACTNPLLNGVATFTVDITIQQTGNQMQQTWHYSAGPCTFPGNYSQLGRMGTFFSSAAVSTCNGLSAGNAYTMYQMTNQPFMFMARYHNENSSNGCIQDGEIVGVIPR